jgi:hypothetical protein
MRVPRTASILGSGVAVGVAAYLITGTFHWAYLAALVLMLWLFSGSEGRGEKRPSAAGPACDRTDIGAGCESSEVHVVGRAIGPI